MGWDFYGRTGYYLLILINNCGNAGGGRGLLQAQAFQSRERPLPTSSRPTSLNICRLEMPTNLEAVAEIQAEVHDRQGSKKGGEHPVLQQQAGDEKGDDAQSALQGEEAGEGSAQLRFVQQAMGQIVRADHRCRTGHPRCRQSAPAGMAQSREIGFFRRGC